MPANAPNPGLELRGVTSQNLQLTQRLIMSAHMQQAIRLLQLPLQELETFIEEQVVLNPILEMGEEEEKEKEEIEDSEISKNQEDEQIEEEIIISDNDLSILNRLEDDLKDRFDENETTPIKRSSDEEKLKSYLEQSIISEPNLIEQLSRQATETFEEKNDKEIAALLIGYIDAFGFLKTPLEEICQLHQLTQADVKKVLNEIQTFEPYGVGACSVQESLLIQLRCFHKEKTLAYQIIRDYYEELIHNQIPSIQKSLRCSYEEIQAAIEKDISKLDLHPGSQFSSLPNGPIIPDVTIRQENEKLIVEVEKEDLPALRLNRRYMKMLEDPGVSNETKHFLKHHLFSARWLVRNLQQRFSTLERITQLLAIKQVEFFSKPEGQLTPLTMKTIADELNLHESTIARTVSNKYVYSPRGLLPLRSFFTNKYVSEEGEDLSSSTVKQALLDILEKEDKKHPLSDEKISLLLKEKGISCARRTVAKYRFVLEIGNTQQRRKFH